MATAGYSKLQPRDARPIHIIKITVAYSSFQQKWER